MTKTITTSILFVALALGGCAARQTSPTSRATAARLFAQGQNCDQIAHEMQVDRDQARELIRTGMADLNRKFYKSAR